MTTFMPPASREIAVFERQQRHIPRQPLRPDSFLDSVVASLTSHLSQKGFKRFGSADFQKAVVDAGMWPSEKPLGFLAQDEYIFSSSSDKPQSNFFVFMRKIEGAIIISYHNPINPSQDASALELPESLINVKRIIKPNGNFDPAQFANEIEAAAKLKDPNVYSAQTHNHLGYVLDTHMRDDGESYFLDFIRSAVFHHLDMAVWSPHNWTADENYRAYKLMKPICDKLGIIFPRAVELTLPLKSGKPSGSHALIIGGDPRTLDYVHEHILKRRDPRVHLISCYMGMEINDMLAEIEQLRRLNGILLGIPHPFSDSTISIAGSGVLRLASNGIMSAVDTGDITLDRALEILANADFVGAFNPTLTDAATRISKIDLWRFATELVRKHGTGRIASANAINLALAKEYGRNSAFDPDDHRTLPDSIAGAGIYYDFSASKWGMGHTHISFSRDTWSDFVPLNRKPTERELVEWIADGRALMDAIVFQKQNEAGMPKIVSERTRFTENPDQRRQIEAELKQIQNLAYVSGFTRSVADLGAAAFDILE